MIENDYHNECDFIRIINEHYCYNDCVFNFEDEVNLSHKIYGKRRKNYCDVFRIKLYNEIKKFEWLIDKIVENANLVNEKQPDDWNKYVIPDMEYRKILIEKRNKWNKIIEKHKDNMSINGISHDKLCIKTVEDYHEVITGSRRF